MNWRLSSEQDKAANKAKRLRRRNFARRLHRGGLILAGLRSPITAFTIMRSQPGHEEAMGALLFGLSHGNRTRSLVRGLNFHDHYLDDLVEPVLPVVAESDLVRLKTPTRVLRGLARGHAIVWPFTAPEIPVPASPGERGKLRDAYREISCDIFPQRRQQLWPEFLQLLRPFINQECRFRLLQFLSRIGSESLASVAWTLARDGRFAAFTEREIDSVELAAKTERYWKDRRTAYAAMVLAFQLKIAAGDLGGGITHSDMEELREGIKVPNRFRREHYLINLVRTSVAAPAALDFYSLKYHPLFRIPIRTLPLLPDGAKMDWFPLPLRS